MSKISIHASILFQSIRELTSIFHYRIKKLEVFWLLVLLFNCEEGKNTFKNGGRGLTMKTVRFCSGEL